MIFLSIYVYFCVFPLQEVNPLCFHLGTSEETSCSGFPSNKCLVLGEDSLQGQSIFESSPAVLCASAATASASDVLLTNLTETSNKKQSLLLLLAVFIFL